MPCRYIYIYKLYTAELKSKSIIASQFAHIYTSIICSFDQECTKRKRRTWSTEFTYGMHLHLKQRSNQSLSAFVFTINIPLRVYFNNTIYCWYRDLYCKKKNRSSRRLTHTHTHTNNYYIMGGPSVCAIKKIWSMLFDRCLYTYYYVCAIIEK